MFNFKKILLAVIISCSIGTMSVYSTAATAEMRPNKEVCADIVKSLKKTLAGIENNEPQEDLLAEMQNARQFSKGISVGPLGAITERGTDALRSSQKNIKNGDMDAARESVTSAIQLYTEMGNKTL